MGGTGWAWFQLTDLVDTLGDPFARNPSSCENQDYLAPRRCDVRSVFHLGCLGVLRSLDHHFLKCMCSRGFNVLWAVHAGINSAILIL